MFGYVTIYKPELKIKDYETYKGVYCTLCKEMGKEYGLLSRCLLSYDGAFYVLYKLGLNNEDLDVKKSRCTFNPCKRCLKVGCKSNVYKLASAITVILAYFKLVDNIKDGGFIKKLLLYLIYPYFALLKNKAKKKYNDIFETIKNGMDEQFSVEAESEVSLDKAAHPTAKMLGWLFSYGESEEKQKNSYDFGYQLGRAVYFLDAYDDFEKDKQSKSFNPFENTVNIIDDAKISINLSIGELTKISKTISLNKFSAVADNIMYEGLNYQIERITQKYRGEINE
jgi:hypothetical protein